MDAVSDVLRVVRLGGAVYLNGEFTAPWCIIGQTDAALCAAFLPRSERVVSYHLITGGSCWARLADDPGSAIHLSAGELLVVPQGETHIMGSALDLSPVPSAPLLASQLETTPGGGTLTRIVCGFLACDETLSNPLLSARESSRSICATILARNGLSHRCNSLPLRRRSGAPAAQSSSPVSELLFVEAVRRCIDALPADRKGWLAGVRDRFFGRALAMLHAQPAHSWTVDELARKVGLSRSALAQRFTDLLGQPPMQYLARWRLQIAAQELLNGSKSLAAVAAQVGYDSEAAFNRAFKREFGMPPGRWRNNRGKADVAGAPANTMQPVDETTAAA